MILKHHIVIKIELLIRYNQTFYLIKFLAFLLILVKVYWLNDKGSLSCLLVIVIPHFLIKY